MKMVEASFDKFDDDNIKFPINWDFIGMVDWPEPEGPQWIKIDGIEYERMR